MTPLPKQSEITINVKRQSYLAGFLSYLVPGLGQIVQGRYGKGILFLICLWGMFFTGQAMGGWRNVYLPNKARGAEENWKDNARHWPRPLANLLHRWQFAGQFWIGVAAWPAIVQYNRATSDENESPPVEDLDKKPSSFWHDFQRAPVSDFDEYHLNEKLRAEDKSPDLGWVYTVIAGVLNILVIYDAFAGPAVLVGDKKKSDENKIKENGQQSASAEKESMQ